MHEFGHFLAGAEGGIPTSEMNIRLLTLPPHIVCAMKGDGSIPLTTRYVSASALLLNDRSRSGGRVSPPGIRVRGRRVRLGLRWRSSILECAEFAHCLYRTFDSRLGLFSAFSAALRENSFFPRAGSQPHSRRRGSSALQMRSLFLGLGLELNEKFHTLPRPQSSTED